MQAVNVCIIRDWWPCDTKRQAGPCGLEKSCHSLLIICVFIDPLSLFNAFRTHSLKLPWVPGSVPQQVDHVLGALPV